MTAVEPRWVFDTNTLLSALLFANSIPGQAFVSAQVGGHILASLETATELSEVLFRSKFDRYITREERESFLIAYLREAIIVDIN